MSANSPRAEKLLNRILKDEPSPPKQKPVAALDRGHERIKPTHAAVALVRNAREGTNLAKHTVIVSPVVSTLEEDGCDFIESLHAYLEGWGCPGDIRQLIACIIGRTGGASSDISIVDAEVGKRAGRSEQWVGRKRKALFKWERQVNFPVLEVTEGDFDRNTGRNVPTRYQVFIIEEVAEILQRARASSLWKKNSRRAIEVEADEMVRRRRAEMVGDPAFNPVNERKPTQRKDPAAVISQSKATIYTLAQKIFDVETNRGGDPETQRAEIVTEVNRIFSQLPFAPVSP